MLYQSSHIESKFYEITFPWLHSGCALIPQLEIQPNRRISFFADFALFNPLLPKPVILECDGIDYHRGWDEEHYDELRDAILLLNNHCSHVIRITGKAIVNHLEICLDFINQELNKQNIPFLAMDKTEGLPDLTEFVTIRDRKWLMDSGIMREAKWVIEESDCPFYEAHKVFLQVIEQNL